MKTFNFIDEGYKVGDKVWNFTTNEWETIRKIEPDEFYPIRFYDSRACKADGRITNLDVHPNYFPNKFDIPDSAFEKPLSELEVDAKVFVKGCKPSCNDSENCKWKPMHFKSLERYEGAVLMTVFADGKTSHTTESTETYDYWSLTEPKESE